MASEHQIRVYTRQDCKDWQAAKKFLAERNIPYQEIDIEDEPQAAAFVRRVNDGKRRTPTIEASGRTLHASHFDPHKFARDLGLE
jgi:mycoredoxin